MAVFDSHSEFPRPRLPERLQPLAPVFRQFRRALRVVHRAIIAAKMRRLQRELMLRELSGDDTELPQPQPLIFDDKWDF